MIPYQSRLCCAVLCCAVLCCAVLCCAVLVCMWRGGGAQGKGIRLVQGGPGPAVLKALSGLESQQAVAQA